MVFKQKKYRIIISFIFIFSNFFCNSKTEISTYNKKINKNEIEEDFNHLIIEKQIQNKLTKRIKKIKANINKIKNKAKINRNSKRYGNENEIKKQIENNNNIIKKEPLALIHNSKKSDKKMINSKVIKEKPTGRKNIKFTKKKEDYKDKLKTKKLELIKESLNKKEFKKNIKTNKEKNSGQKEIHKLKKKKIKKLNTKKGWLKKFKSFFKSKKNKEEKIDYIELITEKGDKIHIPNNQIPPKKLFKMGLATLGGFTLFILGFIIALLVNPLVGAPFTFGGLIILFSRNSLEAHLNNKCGRKCKKFIDENNKKLKNIKKSKLSRKESKNIILQNIV